MLSIIVAVAKNGVIGKDNALIWHLPNDLQYFKKLTTNHIIVMGRNTLESLPFKLPNRTHWVVTTQKDYVAPFEGVRVFHSLEEMLAAVQELSNEEVFCIGGAHFYESCLPYVDRIYRTDINHEFEGDAYFPTYDENQFVCQSEEQGTVDEKNVWPHTFRVFARIGK